ncbi:MAG: Ig-like domain-containing protein, partial [Acidimicrobiia bacterium]|nr:Ig-like domain-containing protein [Acidimicrobiia bacterium]
MRGVRMLLLVALVGVGVAACTPSGPHVRSVEPANGAGNVSRSTSVILNLSEPASGASIGPSSVKIIRSGGSQVGGNYNTDAAASLVSFTPSSQLAANTKYVVQTNANLKTSNGTSYESFTSSFTTGEGGTASSGLSFSRSSVGGLTAPTAVTKGPDNRVYVATGIGEILSWAIDANGVPTGSPRRFTPFGEYQRTIIGLRWDPAATATSLKLWVSHNSLGYQNMPNYTGTVSVLTGSSLTPRDVITGLPRSVKDHMTNSIVFRGTDASKLYISQGSNNGYGGPTPGWGNRAEDPLSAAILVADLAAISSGTVNVDPRSGYNPSTGPVKRYATGVRNAYDLVWHPNGKLYAPVNESAGGDTPAGPGGNPPALRDLPAGRDFLASIQQGGYYGHPNPSIGRYVLNGGNPSGGVDPWEVPQYPVGTQPHSDWKRPIHDFGTHRSPNGIAVYSN